MSAIDTDCLSIGEAAHVLPDYLLISEAGPSMVARLLNELGDCAIARTNEKGLARDTVIVGDLTLVSLKGSQPGTWLIESIPTVLRVVPVIAANAVGCSEVAPIPQVLLAWLLSGTVRLLAHDLFSTNDGEALIVLNHVSVY